MALCELGYYNPHEPDQERVSMDRYEEDIYQEAMRAFEKVTPWDHEAWALCVAYQVVEGYLPASKIMHDLGLNKRHAYILAGYTKEFWEDINGELPEIDD